MQQSHVCLTPAQAAPLTDMTTRGTVTGRAHRRATALLAWHAGQSYSAVARQLGVTYSTVSGWAPRLATAGLAVLVDEPRSGRPLQITGDERAKLTALACSKAPEGHAPEGHSPWSLRLLAGKAVERGYCRQLSAASAHAILKKTRSGPR